MGSLENLQAARAAKQAELDAYDKQCGRFECLAGRHFRAIPCAPMIIPGLVPAGELGVIYGASGSGKTFSALEIAGCIATGRQWNGKITKQGTVVYICAEGVNGFKKRLDAFAETFKELDEPDFYVVPTAPNLMDAKDTAQLAGCIRYTVGDRPLQLIVVDTLSRSHQGNENAGADMGQVLNHCQFLHKQFGALVLLVHHSGKQESAGQRGWSGIKAAADLELEVTRPNGGDLRVIKVTKLKDNEGEGNTYAFKLKSVFLGYDDDGESVSSCVVEHTNEKPAAAVRIGKWAVCAIDAVKQLGEGCTVVAAREQALRNTPHDINDKAELKNLKGSIKRGISSACSKGLLHLKDQKLYRMRVEEMNDGDFLQ